MKQTKLFKKIDMRIIQAMVMIVIAVAFLYLFYYFYSEYSRYQSVKTPKPKGQVQSETIAPPSFFNFQPPKEKTYQYQLFWFREKKADPQVKGKGPVAGKNNARQQSTQYRILGVVKKDKLFLVVRFKRDNKIRLIAEGQQIDNNSSVKSLTYKEAVITTPTGGRQVHKIFKVEPITIQNEKPKGKKKK